LAPIRRSATGTTARSENLGEYHRRAIVTLIFPEALYDTNG
jgi:hypothetical protein